MNTFKEVAVTKRSISKRKLIHGVGINDANYVINPTVNGKLIRCPYYQRWVSMLSQGYSKSYRGNSYTVCEEWLTFSNFKLWMKEQDWEGKTFNVGLKVRNNRIYSPDTCLFISAEVKRFINSKIRYGAVVFNMEKKKFYTWHINEEGKFEYLNGFYTKKEAYEDRIRYVKKVGYDLVEEQDDPKVKEALKQYVDEI